MDMDIAATVLAGSILTGLALVIAVITIVAINNIIHKYWKPIQWLKIIDYPATYSSNEIGHPEPIAESTSTTATVTLKQK